MKIVTGVDLVYLPKFKKALKRSGENFLRRIFSEPELVNKSPQHLAGIFAAKEAVTKALGLPSGCWHDIQIIHEPSGAPKAKILNSKFTIHNSSLSISHDGNYTVAQFVALLK